MALWRSTRDKSILMDERVRKTAVDISYRPELSPGQIERLREFGEEKPRRQYRTIWRNALDELERKRTDRERTNFFRKTIFRKLEVGIEKRNCNGESARGEQERGRSPHRTRNDERLATNIPRGIENLGRDVSEGIDGGARR